MKTYKIKINSKNKMIPIKGRLIRSPVEFIVPESKLSYYKTLIKKMAILEFNITDYMGEKIKLKKPSGKKINVEKPKTNFRDGEKKTLDSYF